MAGAARAPEHRVRCLHPVTLHGGDERLPFEIDGANKSVGPKIGGFNKMLVSGLPDRALDLLEIASLVYGVDAAVSRGGSTDQMMGGKWHRGFRIEMAVRDVEVWSDPTAKDALEQMLMFLSGDRFSFEFSKRTNGHNETSYFDFTPEEGWQAERVLMFSGGLDSYAGALEEIIEQGKRVALVSHASSTKLSPVQKQLYRTISARLGPDSCRHIPVTLQLARGTNKEGTHRSRSFLFAVLGLITAFAFGRNRVSFHENGVVSLNLPPVGQVLGTRATRTTHPQTLKRFSEVFSIAFNKPIRVDNPFFWRTKTEVVQTIARLEMADQIVQTTSCADTHNRTKQHPHCGRCSQCIDRRFAILAAGLERFDPADSYAVDLLTGRRDRVQHREIALSYVRNALAFEVMEPADCLTSAPTGQIPGFERRRISGSSQPLWSEDEQEIRNIEGCR